MPSPIQTLKRYEASDAAATRDVRRLRSLDLVPNREPVVRFPGNAPQAPTTGERGRRCALTLADTLAVIVGVLVTVSLAGLPFMVGGLVASMVTALTFVRLTSLHNRDTLVLLRSTLDETPRLLEAAALSACAYWLILPQGPGRLPLLILTVSLAAAMLTLRAGARLAFRQLAAPERCLYIGDMSVVDILREKIHLGPANAVIVGALPLAHTATADDIGGVEGLRRIVHEMGVVRVILAPLSPSAADTLELIRVAKDAHVRVSIFPRLIEVVGAAVEYEDLEGLMLMGVRRFGLSTSARHSKRAFDLVLGGLTTLACAPLMGLIAIVIRLDSKGPVLFRQVRVGRDGDRFGILKFRSMVAEAEGLKDELRRHNETDGLFKIADDPRVTRVGRVLRRTSLDELPQLLNVLRGDMSLVGPRPLVVDEDEKVSGLDRRRLHLTPGMTGPWQIMRSGRVPMDEMVSIDYHYVSSWSLWTDVKVLLRTIGYVLGRHGL